MGYKSDIEIAQELSLIHILEGTSGNFATHLHVGIYIPVEGQEDLSVNPYYLLRYLEGEKVTIAEYSFEKLPASQ